MMDGVLARRDNPLGGAARRGKGKAALGNVFNSEFAKCQRDQIAIFISEWPLIKALGRCGSTAREDEAAEAITRLERFVLFCCPFTIEPHLTNALR